MDTRKKRGEKTTDWLDCVCWVSPSDRPAQISSAFRVVRDHQSACVSSISDLHPVHVWPQVDAIVCECVYRRSNNKSGDTWIFQRHWWWMIGLHVDIVGRQVLIVAVDGTTPVAGIDIQWLYRRGFVYLLVGRSWLDEPLDSERWWSCETVTTGRPSPHEKNECRQRLSVG